MKYFLFGSPFIDELSNHFPQEEISYKLTYSLRELTNTFFVANEKTRKNWLDYLEQCIINSHSETFVFDLRCFVHLYDMKPTSELNSFIDIIQKHYNNPNIILIKTIPSKWYVIDTQLRENKNYQSEENSLQSVRWAEEYVINKTPEIGSIDVTQFYFYSKKAGYKVATYLYEAECYKDIVLRLHNVINLQDPEPYFIYSINRYLRYYYETIRANAFDTFLSRNSNVNSMLLDSPADFVKDNYDNFIYFKRLENKNLQMDDKADSYFKKILESHTYLSKNSSYNIAHMDFRPIFVNAIVPNKILKWIRKEFAPNNKLITSDNAGYYFARLHSISHVDALEYISNDITIKPTLIDVYGSCITRTCFGKRFTNNTTMASNLYFFHIPPYRTTTKKYYLPELQENNLQEKHRLVKYQLENIIPDLIDKSDATWLIIDLFSMYSRIYNYNGLLFTDFHNVISKSIKGNPLTYEEKLENWNGLDGLYDLVSNWCNMVRMKYGNRIILVDTKLSHLLLGDDNHLYCPYDFEKTNQANILIDYVQECIKEKLDCYSLEISGQFFSDDKGYLSRAQVHYEMDFYKELFSHVKYIVKNEPAQKRFMDYNVTTRLDRIIKLSPHNDIHILLNYFKNPLDMFVLQLPVTIIQRHFEIISEWYRNNYVSKSQILEHINSTDNTELYNAILPLHEIEKAKLESIKFIKDYPRLTDDDVHKLQKKFTIHFDGNGADGGQMKDLTCLFGKIYTLPVNTFVKKGYSFVGWNSLRTSDNKMGYTNGSIHRFYIQNTQPADMKPLLYKDQCKIKCCSRKNDDLIIFFAQWKKSNSDITQ